MTVRDGLPHVLEAVASVLAQDHPSFELVVVDDGSQDGTAEALAGMRDDRLRLVRRPPLGRVRALNTALAAARGRYVANLDADDIALPDRLTVCEAFLDDHPEVAVVGAAVVPHVGSRARLPRRLPRSDVALRWAFLVRNPMVHSSVMFRASALTRAGGYSRAYERRCQDADLLLRLGAEHAMANLDRALVLKRLHPGQHFASVDAAHRARVHRELRRRAARELGFPRPLRPVARALAEVAGVRSWVALRAGARGAGPPAVAGAR
jgi:glycosyltransferase involved in cell wall biosynthesis